MLITNNLPGLYN